MSEEVTLVDVKVSVPKELSDIKDLLVSVAQDLIGGKKAMEVAYDVLPKLQKAVEGVGSISAEVKSPQVYSLGALLVADVISIVLAAKAAKAVAAVAASGVSELAAPAI